MDNDADFINFDVGDEGPPQPSPPSSSSSSRSSTSPPAEEKTSDSEPLDRNHPSVLSATDITPANFHKLLACYPRTVKAVHHHRAIERVLTPKGKKALVERKKAVAAAARAGKPADELDTKQLAQVEKDVKAFLELDEWRYSQEGVAKSARRGHLEGREVERLVEWKMKHGVYRPTLLGMVKSNQEKLIQKSTREAFATLLSGPLPSITSRDSLSAPPISTDFPKSAVAALTDPLRGVGPATASLFLSVASPTTPFYSDDTFLWVCQGEAPQTREAFQVEAADQLERMNEHKRKRVRVRTDHGEIKAKYSLGEYEQLWGAVGSLRARLYGLVEEEGGEGEFLCEQIEKVAFVLRHIEMSGYLEDHGLNLMSADEGVRAMDAIIDARETKYPKKTKEEKKAANRAAKKRGGRNEKKKDVTEGVGGKRKREDDSGAGSGRNLRRRK